MGWWKVGADNDTILAGLVVKVNDSPEQKDILDLQARINAEGIFLQKAPLWLWSRI